MLRRSLVLFLVLAILQAPLVAAQGDSSHIGVDSVRADRLDLDNDGERDTIRVVYLLNTSAHYAEVKVQVDVASGGVELTFWDNGSFNSSDPYYGTQDIEAWGDGSYAVMMKVWDGESGILVHTEDFGEFDLIASLTQPYLRFDLNAADTIMLGNNCTIERVFLDEVGERYDALGTVSLTGTPWMVPDDFSDIDCSSWPARDYQLEMFYRNDLGFSTSAQLELTINTLPPPRFTLEVIGDGEEVGTECSISVKPAPGTVMALMTTEWEITDPRQEPLEVGGFSAVDCQMWQVGVTKVRATVTSQEGQTTNGAVNVVRIPPSGNASQEVINASGPENMWPERSAGEEYQTTPFFGESSLVAQILVFFVSGSIALLLGLLGGSFWIRGARIDEEYVATLEPGFEPETDGLPSYVDPSGIYWRQHPDGNVDWFDTVSAQWVPYEEV